MALPQYQVALAEAKYTQAVNWVDTVWRAQQLCKLHKGRWCNNYNTMKINVEKGKKAEVLLLIHGVRVQTWLLMRMAHEVYASY